ncbi:MAG TPA: DUF1476 domain-containing protein [Sphingomicrobium sp.]|jgi:Uncharacterized conserved protein|nr:DUF1476 domain-containing protein [Sphingomicrobium sp.]
MSQFDEHDRSFEAKFAQDEEMLFRILARRNRLLGEWAARLMGLSEAEAEAYSKDLVRADFEGGGGKDVILKLLGDLTAAGVEIDEERIREAIKQKLVEARRQLIG